MTDLAHHLDTASEAVRAANHATMRAALDGPESYQAVGALAEITDRLPQVLDYLTRSLRRAEPVEHCDDRGADAASTLCLAHGHIADARGFVTAAADQLHTAHNQLGHIGRRAAED